MSTTKFLHVTIKGDVKPSRDGFIDPFKNKNIRENSEMGYYNLDRAYYFSKAIGESSMWLDFRKYAMTEPRTDEEIEDENKKDEFDKRYTKETEPYLISKDYYYVDIDLEEKRIYVINTPTELRDFFVKYSIIERYGDFSGSKDYSSLKRYELVKINKILIDYLINLSYADRLLFGNITTVYTIKNNRNRRNMSLVKIDQDKIIIDKRKSRFGFLIDIIRTIEYNDKIIGDPSTICTTTRIETIDYVKLRNDGYNGIYYSDSLIRVNSSIEEEDADTYRRYFEQTFVQKIDIGHFPDIIGNTSNEDLRRMKFDIETFIRWLGSDTLVVWKWIFD